MPRLDKITSFKKRHRVVCKQIRDWGAKWVGGWVRLVCDAAARRVLLGEPNHAIPMAFDHVQLIDLVPAYLPPTTP